LPKNPLSVAGAEALIRALDWEEHAKPNKLSLNISSEILPENSLRVTKSFWKKVSPFSESMN